MQLWMAADMLPTLVFVGDFWQLQGVEPSKARDSPLWSNPVHMVRRELHTMQRCKCDELDVMWSNDFAGMGIPAGRIVQVERFLAYEKQRGSESPAAEVVSGSTTER